MRRSTHGAAVGIAALAAGVACAVAIPGAAQAQETFNVERFRPALDRHGFLGIQGTRPPAAGRWNVGSWLNLNEEPLVLQLPDDDGTRRVEVVERRVTQHFQAQVGIAGRVALAVDWPVVWWQQGQTAPGRPDLAHVAAGDPRLVARVRAVGEPARARDRRAQGFGLAVLASSTLPLGTDDAFASEESAVTNLQVLADFHVLGAGAGVMLGWRHRFDEVPFGTTRFRDELEAGLGVKIPIPPVPGLAGLVELRTATDARSPFGDEARTAVELDVGTSWQRSDYALRAAIGTGLTSGVGTPRVRGVVGFSWRPTKHDADGDGISDDADECTHLPEDLDGFEDADGCPDPDNDGDMIPDEDDRCPNEAAVPGRDEDRDGCTDPRGEGESAKPPGEASSPQSNEKSP